MLVDAETEVLVPSLEVQEPGGFPGRDSAEVN